MGTLEIFLSVASTRSLMTSMPVGADGISG